MYGEGHIIPSHKDRLSFNRALKERLRKSFDLGQFNWIGNLKRILYYYNNNRHRATGLKPFLLFKGFDNSLDFSMSDSNTLMATENLLRYIETYRREFIVHNNQGLQVNDRVLLMRPYSTNNRRRALDSLYFDQVFIILEFNNEKVHIKEEEADNFNDVHYCMLKKINNL